MNISSPDDPLNYNVEETTIAEERVRVLFNGVPLSLAVTVLLDIILSVSHWNVIGHGELILWNIFMLCSLSLRVAIWYFWRNTRYSMNTHYWLNIFRVGAWVAGCTWGSSAVFMFASFNPTYQALLAFTLAGVASGSLTTLAIDKWSAIGFVALAIFPLSARIYMEQHAIAIPMTIMTVMYILFVIFASTRARHNLEEHFKKNARLISWSKERIKQQKLSKAISASQSIFINEANSQKTFEQLLNDILELTDSKFGFIGEVFYESDNQPFLRMQALTNIAWDNNSKELHEKHHSASLEFKNLNTLFGAALISRKHIISNTPAQDMRAGGTPVGHPTLTAFLGIPIFSGTTLVAMLGLANKPDGYTEDILDFLKPLTSSISQFIIAVQNKRLHQEYELKLEHHAKHTQAILDEAFDAIITVNKSGIILSFNHAAEIIFGYRANQIIGESIISLLPEPYKSRHEDYFEKNQQTALVQVIGLGQEIAGLRRNGKEFPMELAVSEITENNEPIYVGVARDISERKHTETLKNQFISTVSHELRTPLTSISASLALIESGSLGDAPEKMKNLIRIAHQNSMRLQVLINDLLDIEKLLTNNIQFDIKTHAVQPILDMALKVNQYYADKYQVHYRIAEADKTLHINGDVSRVQQVLGNLLANAAKFSNKHDDIDIAVTREGNFIKFSVTDYGAGIPPSFKAHIFQRFSQADSSDTRKKEGSGLGLAISKELVEKMGGKIGFTSNPGEGSCFYFLLPAANMSPEDNLKSKSYSS